MKPLIAFILLMAALATAYFTSDKHDLDKGPKFAPNTVYRPQIPIKPDSECPNTPEFRSQVAVIDKQIPLASGTHDSPPVMW